MKQNPNYKRIKKATDRQMITDLAKSKNYGTLDTTLTDTFAKTLVGNGIIDETFLTKNFEDTAEGWVSNSATAFHTIQRQDYSNKQMQTKKTILESIAEGIKIGG